MIPDKDVPYSIVVENITVEETEEYVQSICNAFMCFLYVQFGVSKKA